MSNPPARAAEIDIVVPNFNRRFSGVTSTVRTLLPVQAKSCRIAGCGTFMPEGVPVISRWRLLRLGKPPAGRRFRIFHARRNVEMVWGVLLRDVLRQPWKLVFTSAAQRHHKPFTRWLIARMDALISTSPQAASYLRHPSTTIMHGIDTALYRPPSDRQAAWAETGLPGTLGIGVFGRVRAQKGTDIFVESMCRLLPARPGVTAVIIGLTTPSEQAFADALEAKIDAAGLRGRILFLGEKPASEIPGWFRALSVYVAPMRNEGFGLTPLEAMASETPVVATRAGAAADLLVDNETGFLVDPGDIDGLTARTAALLDDPSLRGRMGKAGRRRVEENFAVAREAAEIVAVYEKLWNAG